MTTADQLKDTQAVLLRRDDGALYLVPTDLLDQCRVPDDLQDAVAQAAAGDDAGADTAGFHSGPVGGGAAGRGFTPVQQRNFGRIAAHLDPTAQQAFWFWLAAIGAIPRVGRPSQLPPSPG